MSACQQGRQHPKVGALLCVWGDVLYPVVSCSRPSHTPQAETTIFPCISLLTHALGMRIKEQLQSILDPMFAMGLSQGLTSSLEVIAAEVPALEPDIQSEDMDTSVV